MYKRISKIKLGTDKSHTQAMLMHLTNSLVINESIETTSSRAKAVKANIDRLINIAKEGSLTSSRRIYSIVNNDRVADKLINNIAKRFEKKTSGYTSTFKLGFIKGNGADLLKVSFSDYVPASKRDKKKAKKSDKTKAKKEEKPVKEEDKGGIFGRVKNLGRKSNTPQVSGSTDKGRSNTRSGLAG